MHLFFYPFDSGEPDIARARCAVRMVQCAGQE